MSTSVLGDRDISAAELLHRDDRPLHGDTARAQITGHRVLVTGAGGSIGSEIVRQVSTLGPETLFLLDHDENALHTIQLELNGHGLLDTDTIILADIREASVVDRVMREIRPDVVFHAAAHKHLPMLERFPGEALRTNVLGTANVVRAAAANGAKAFINISTDKAASPTSVLGASKRLAEMVVSSHASQGIQVASVRFGNVLGSRGSLLRSLAYQVARGLPVTVTDPDVTRFFMTIPEAASLVIEASAMADRGEIYVLDMGEPVRILELVQRYAQMLGCEVDITFTGLRPGEKLHEELFEMSEVRVSTGHRRIWCVAPTGEQGQQITASVEALARSDGHISAEEVRAELFDLLPLVSQPDGAGELVVA